MRGQWTPSSNARAPGWRPSSFVGCALYTRQSVSRPDDEFSSCAAQRAACLDFLGRQEKLWLPLGEVFERAAAGERPSAIAAWANGDEVEVGSPGARTRCSGCSGPCPDSQVAARDLEDSVVQWLTEPPRDEMPEAIAKRLRDMMSTWSLLWPVNRQRILAAMIEELRWDGAASTFTIALNVDWIMRGQQQDAEPETSAVARER
jgi:hypothetical protein